MTEKTKSGLKTGIIITGAVLFHIIVILVTIFICKNYDSKTEERRIENALTDGWLAEDNISEDKLAGMIFEYETTYKFKDGDQKKYDGKEVYYWDGKQFVLVSDYMKGYDDK